MHNIDDDFKKYFPKLKFNLKEFQRDVIRNVIEKDNTLCIMPTGGGKSVIYWMSAIEMEGIAIVISPLTALIAEQAEKIEEQGYKAMVIHSGIDAKKQMQMLSDFAKGKYNPKFIFASPEKIATDGYFEFCLKNRKDDIKLMVIDEVHCVSQWGISFRPFYKRIPDFMDKLFGEVSWCRILALTATLNPLELNDICDSFKITTDNILKQSMLMRSEIQLHVRKYLTEDEKEADFWELIKRHKGEKTLVYLYRKKGDRGVDGLCLEAQNRGYRAAEFHGDMNSDERMDIIEQYRNGEVDIIFATNAFGMGIDISDIRVVIHFMIPESAEQYYQEVGRAARDGNGANAYLLYSNKNIDIKRTYFIDRSFPTEKKLRETYANFGKKCGVRVLPYFDNVDIQDCLPYYINCGLVRIICKGFSGISELCSIKDSQIKELYDSTPAKAYVRTIKKNGLEPQEFSDMIYQAVLDDKVKLNKALERWIVADIKDTKISDEQMQAMLDEIEEKKKYKHSLLDYFVQILQDEPNSQQLHQEIARYLGMDKYQLKRIYKTIDGNDVRSKSEVIICNLLYNAGIRYKYEEALEYEPGKIINPDFTIMLSNGKKVYWEHVGMLGNEKYDSDWSHKVEIYEKYYPGLLYRTYETGALSRDAEMIIEKIKQLD